MSKSGQFKGAIHLQPGGADGGRGCLIYPRVTVGNDYVGTVVVPDALDESWRYPANLMLPGGEAEILKIGRLLVAIKSNVRRRSDWGLFSIHKSHPLLGLLLMLSLLFSWGTSLLFLYLPIYLWGQGKVTAFLGVPHGKKQSTASTHVITH